MFPLRLGQDEFPTQEGSFIYHSFTSQKKYCHCNSFVCHFVGWHIVRGMFLPAWHKMVLGVVPWKGYLLCSLECYASNQLQQIRLFSTNHARSFVASTPRWVWTWMILNGKCAKICSFFSSNGIMKTAFERPNSFKRATCRICLLQVHTSIFSRHDNTLKSEYIIQSKSKSKLSQEV